jgi:N-acetylglucosamine kinase-like BadF-type ATPase
MNKTEATRSRHLVVGVDGGGSKTLALVADTQGKILGRAIAGPSNYQVVGQKAACAAIAATIRGARARIPGELSALCLGIAGAGRVSDRAMFQAWAETHYPGIPIRVVHDGQLALAAGTPEGWGIAVLCGTGSLVYGEDRQGRPARAGGWGYLLGDEGSGYAIGLAALQAVARAADGRGPATALTQAILTHWSLDKPQDLIAHVYRPTLPRTEIAGLAEILVDVAERGDQVAHELLTAAGEELAQAARAVAAQLALPQPIPCALAGGFILHAAAVRQSFQQTATALGLTLNPITRVPEPAQGAVRLARQLLKAR